MKKIEIITPSSPSYLKRGIRGGVIMALLLCLLTPAFAGTASQFPYGIAADDIYDYDASTGWIGIYKLSLPTLTANDTICGIATTQTLTNKTLTSPTLNTPTFSAGAVGTNDIAANAVTRVKMSTAAASNDSQTISATIATTGNTDGYVIAPQTGSLTGVDFSGVDALAANDTNYITFSITNLGQAGAGSTVMLAATDVNTTKATGGTAIVANGKRSLTLTGTGADLNVTAGDRLRIRAAATGTLANTVTFPIYLLRFGGTT